MTSSVFNWKDAVKEALEEVCMVAVHPSDLLAAKQAGMGTAYSAPQLDEPDVPGMTLQELPPREAYDYYADSKRPSGGAYRAERNGKLIIAAVLQLDE